MITQATSAAIAGTLHLVCLGGGAANHPDVRSVYGYGSDGSSAWGQAVGSRAVPFDDQVNIEINPDGTGRVRMPRTMLPKFHGGNDGWFDIEDFRASDSEFAGKVGLNFINSPKFRIDRMTGHISMSGKSGAFSGTCQAYDPSATKRQF